jgi:flagellar biosynthesis/type III secretory pathway M-ring protein FliF/YscJ
MELLRRAFAQLHERFRSMTPGSRLMAVLLAAAVLVGLICLGTQQRTCADTDLLQGVTVAKSRLPRMLAAFGKAKLADYEIRGSSIFVPHGRQSTYMEALRAADALPRGLGEAMPKALSEGTFLDIGSSRDQQRINIAKQTQVADAIRSRSGIEDASVIYDETKAGGFQPKVAKAVVYVWPEGSSQLDEAAVIDIRNDVVGAYAELKPENVTVSDLNGHTWRGNVGSADEIRYRALMSARRQQPRAGSPLISEARAVATAGPAADWSEWSRKAWQWAQQWWKPLAGVGFALVCLLVLRSMIGAKTTEAEPAAAATASASPADKPAVKAALPPPHWRRDFGVDRSLREELSELVEADPETAANILSNWIGQTS